MRPLHRSQVAALVFSLALHALVYAVASGHRFRWSAPAPVRQAEERVIYLQAIAPPPQRQPAPTPPQPAPAQALSPSAAVQAERPLATQAAPPAPTAEEWAFAARYTQKNSKGYRYSWGQQVRSMMGTAVEGPDQGVVRFRVEIAPDGQLAGLHTLWSTSSVAERLARQAIESLPPLPPTPTGQPLVFERTIAFTPHASDGPPLYQDDCLPDPPAFRNPFAWDGRSAQVRSAPEAAQKLDPQALEECLRQLPRDSLEAELARDRRLMERWGAAR